jgi:hypothetical protein
MVNQSHKVLLFRFTDLVVIAKVTHYILSTSLISTPRDITTYPPTNFIIEDHAIGSLLIVDECGSDSAISLAGEDPHVFASSFIPNILLAIRSAILHLSDSQQSQVVFLSTSFYWCGTISGVITTIGTFLTTTW